MDTVINIKKKTKTSIVNEIKIIYVADAYNLQLSFNISNYVISLSNYHNKE